MNGSSLHMLWRILKAYILHCDLVNVQKRCVVHAVPAVQIQEWENTQKTTAL